MNKQLPVFRVTVKKIIEKLSSLKDIPISNFKDQVREQFDGYDYQDIEILKGIDTWCDFMNNEKYQLSVGINHAYAYQFTLYINIKNNCVTIYNVL